MRRLKRFEHLEPRNLLAVGLIPVDVEVTESNVADGLTYTETTIIRFDATVLNPKLNAADDVHLTNVVFSTIGEARENSEFGEFVVSFQTDPGPHALDVYLDSQFDLLLVETVGPDHVPGSFVAELDGNPAGGGEVTSNLGSFIYFATGNMEGVYSTEWNGTVLGEPFNGTDDVPFTADGVMPAGLPVPDSNLKSVSGRAFSDVNENGLRDEGESGVTEMVAVLLKDSVEVERMTVDSDGYYGFYNLTGDNFQVQFINQPSGSVLTTMNAGSDSTIDSDADPQTGITAVLDFSAALAQLNIDAGVIPATVEEVKIDTVGLYQPDVSLFHLKETFTPGASDQYFSFGPSNDAGWIPIVGDWNGDGVDTIGLYQPDISLFHLKDSFTPGASDQYFGFGPGGNAGWIPIAGDWNGDGVDTIGLYQPDISLFHLKDSFTPGASDQYFAFGPGGSAGWVPLAGDWNGDGVDTIGLYQPDISLFHLKDSFTPGASDHYFAFGPAGDAGWTPLAGDWNGDGVDTIGLFQPDVSLFHLKDSFTPGASDQYFGFGPGGNAGWVPLTGDWNGPQAVAPLSRPAPTTVLAKQTDPLPDTEPANSFVDSSGIIARFKSLIPGVTNTPTDGASTTSGDSEENPANFVITHSIQLLDEAFAEW